MVRIGVVGFTWVSLIAWLRGGPQIVPTIEVALTFAVGLLPAWLAEWSRRRHKGTPTGLDRLLGITRLTRADLEPPPSQPSPRRKEIIAALEQIRERFGATRAIIWEIDQENDRAVPLLASGNTPPPTISLAGDPMRLAWEESITLRLETPPRWARDSARACLIPIERPGRYTALLTLEFQADTLFPTQALIEETVARLQLFLEMKGEIDLANEARERFNTIISLLRRLPGGLDLQGTTAELAARVREFTTFSGAAVASWDGEQGEVLVVDSDDGGVAQGTIFGGIESEMALAARSQTTLIRGERTGKGDTLPLIAPGERWHTRPKTRVIIPLQTLANGLTGLLAIWNNEPVRVDQGRLELLQIIAPYIAMQIHQLQLYEPLRELAERDPLTELYNRRVLGDRIEMATTHFIRYRRPIALLILDIDHFKTINDTYGHEAGDVVLKSLGNLLEATIRDTDLAARLGGEEFVLLLPETNLTAALEIAERIRREVEEMRVEWREHLIEIQISIGVAAAPECTDNPADLLEIADVALYTSKTAGRNQVSAAPYAT